MTEKSRRQCKKCPWKKSTGKNIPNGFREDAAELLRRQTSSTSLRPCDPLEVQQCHETSDEAPLPCVGWLVHQLGVGQNFSLRLRVISGDVGANVSTVGPQHRRPEDVVPKR